MRKLKPFTNYICANPECGKSSIYTGSYNHVHRRDRDRFCPSCGVERVEEVKDGSRWRVSWEMVDAIGHPECYDPDMDRPCVDPDDVPADHWHWVHRETDSERDALRQFDGLRLLESEGELIRNVRLDRAPSRQWSDVAAAGAEEGREQ